MRDLGWWAERWAVMVRQALQPAMDAISAAAHRALTPLYSPAWRDLVASIRRVNRFVALAERDERRLRRFLALSARQRKRLRRRHARGISLWRA